MAYEKWLRNPRAWLWSDFEAILAGMRRAALDGRGEKGHGGVYLTGETSRDARRRTRAATDAA